MVHVDQDSGAIAGFKSVEFDFRDSSTSFGHSLEYPSPQLLWEDITNMGLLKGLSNPFRKLLRTVA